MQTSELAPVNNAIYDELGEAWYEAEDNPVALLRAESKLKNPWVAGEIHRRLRPGPQTVLDVGCGAGFLANHLAEQGHRVTGLDASASSLEVAGRFDKTKSVRYMTGDAYALPFADASFDVVCQMDFLEHVDDPARAVSEASRVLKPGGLYFFHTFNRNWLANFVIIKLTEWFVPGTPKDMHVLHLFIKPEELESYCESNGMNVEHWSGIRPKLISKPGLGILFNRRVSPDFEFTLSKSLRLAYLGIARKHHSV